MPTYLCLTVRFHNPLFHGRRDEGEPEWPPSPLRVFQALVAAAAARWKADLFRDYAELALRWLERQPPPEIVAPSAETGSPFRAAVPNNDLDRVARAWTGGNYSNSGDANPATHRSLKTIQPTRLLGGNAVHYAYLLADADPEFERVRESLFAAARSVTHLGWGVDVAMMEAKAVDSVTATPGSEHRWRPADGAGVPLRTPVVGTLYALVGRYREFLERAEKPAVLNASTPLSAYQVVSYHSPTAGGVMPSRPVAAFEIHRTIEDQEKEAGKSKFRPYHHVRRVATVAGMVRHATATVARRIGWSAEEVMRRVEGHGDEKDGQATSDDRLLFLPLPSRTPNGVEGIRRVLVVGPPGFDLAPLRRQLNGEELIDLDSKQAVAMLSGVGSTDKGVMPYLGESESWSTVTPVILPGYDDPDGLRKKLKERVNADEQKHLLERLDSRILALIWKAFHQAGWTADALAGASVEYRKVGWFRGLDLAGNYDLPPLKFPRYHLRVTFPRKVRGPIAVGAGRYRGFGLFVRVEA